MTTSAETYTVQEVATKLGVGEATVYEHCRRGEIPCLYVGRRVIIPRRRFDAWFDGGMVDNSRPADSALKH